MQGHAPCHRPPLAAHLSEQSTLAVMPWSNITLDMPAPVSSTCLSYAHKQDGTTVSASMQAHAPCSLPRQQPFTRVSPRLSEGPCHEIKATKTDLFLCQPLRWFSCAYADRISALLWAAIIMGVQLKTATDAGILWGESRSPYKPTLPSAAATMRAVCALIPGLQESLLHLLDM